MKTETKTWDDRVFAACVTAAERLKLPHVDHAARLLYQSEGGCAVAGPSGEVLHSTWGTFDSALGRMMAHESGRLGLTTLPADPPPSPVVKPADLSWRGSKAATDSAARRELAEQSGRVDQAAAGAAALAAQVEAMKRGG